MYMYSLVLRLSPHMHIMTFAPAPVHTRGGEGRGEPREGRGEPGDEVTICTSTCQVSVSEL